MKRPVCVWVGSHCCWTIGGLAAYPLRMDRKTIDATLASMKPEEIDDAIWMVGMFERWGSMDRAEADEWWRRIAAWQRLSTIEEQPQEPS